MKISKTWQKVCVGVLSLVVLLFAGFGVKTAADEFWGGHEAVQEINHNIDLLSGNLQQRNAELRKSERLLKAANENNKDLEGKLKEKQDLIDENNTKIHELKDKLDALGEENKRLADKGATDKLAYDREVTNLNKWIGKLQEENDANVVEIARLTKENKVAEKQIETLKQDTETKQGQIDKLEKDLDKAEEERDTANQNNQGNEDLLRQAEEDARGTLKKTHDALDRNDIKGHWHNEDNQN
jgi:DNA repair exonuclease SbcCD ATPase subunit